MMGMMGETMGRRWVRAPLLVLLLPLAACFEHTVSTGVGAPNAPVVRDTWEHFWLGGLIGHTRIDIEDVCPSGDATIEARQGFLNGLVAGLTGGIYTPTTLKVRCRDGRRSEFDLSAQEAERIATDERFLEWVAVDLPERYAEVRDALADR